MVASVLIGITLLQAAVGTQVRGHIEDALIAGVGRDLALGTVGRIDYIHRGLAFAVLTAAALQALWLLSRRFPQASQARWSLVVLALAVLQIALGLVMAYGSLVPAAQVGHLAIGSLLLGAETMVWLRRQDAATTPAA
jgi:cytochrome c oxidase assembly protein subunit 15